ncbi:hypothetical protein OYT00_06740 [Microbacterium paraoxydans]|uniref:hypothetical protein n=1 Tax=Microbacterium paraoxydans TaxID=199592 RepID=UPI002285F354|nr:hypothetical protein [Microbacterium paraoxydans]MCZ0709687.1 hypothetical protein [Microbacterium paraoxydans]
MPIPEAAGGTCARSPGCARLKVSSKTPKNGVSEGYVVGLYRAGNGDSDALCR